MDDQRVDRTGGGKIAHLKVALVRLAIAVVIAGALPFSHYRWGASPEAAGVDGPTAFAFLLVFMIVGAFWAAIYFILGSILHFVFRKRIKYAVWFDICFGVVVIATLINGGIMATYQ